MVRPALERFGRDYHPATSRPIDRGLLPADMINRESITRGSGLPGRPCFAGGFEFLDANRRADNWLLQLETFDPHEPFLAPARFRKD